jgi:hypothetical protein
MIIVAMGLWKPYAKPESGANCTSMIFIDSLDGCCLRYWNYLEYISVSEWCTITQIISNNWLQTNGQTYPNENRFLNDLVYANAIIDCKYTVWTI